MAITFNQAFSGWERSRDALQNVISLITLLNNDIERLASSSNPSDQQLRAARNQISNIDRIINLSIDNLNLLSEQIASSDIPQDQQDQLQELVENTGYQFLDQQQRLRASERALSDAERRARELKATQPKDSAGDIVQNEAEAQEEDAKTQTPNPPAIQNPAPASTSNATTPVIAPDQNLAPQDGATAVANADKPTVGLNQSQQTPNGNPTEKAASDDATDSKRQPVGTSKGGSNRPEIPNEFLKRIVPKGNILTYLSSYTYATSIYIMNFDEYRNLLASQKKVLPTKQLIIQSGGAATADRNPWFNVDFYLEDLTIESVVGTQGNGAAHNVTTMEFTVKEPNGITFLNRLNNAVIEHSGATNALSQVYLMVIRFYGYDQDGNQVTSAELSQKMNTEVASVTDQNAVAEKFIPFMITGFKYNIRSDTTEYRIQAASPNTKIAFSSERASVPFNMRLVASDVQTLLNGNLIIADDEQTAASSEDEPGTQNNNQTGIGLKGATITQGLAEALNENQRRLVAAGTYSIADEYEIVLDNVPGLRDAKMAKPGRPDKKQAGGNTPQTAANQFLANKTQYDKDTKTYNIQAGMQVQQLIDLVMRTSSYMTSQQNVTFDEKTGKIVGKSSNVQTVQWYRIRTQTTPLGFDTKRKAMAFRIRYTISQYQINTPRSPYYPPAVYRGVHKLYNYWFTGENTEVLDFNIEVNSNYFVTVGNDGYVDETPQGRFPVTNAYQSAPGGSLQGGTRGSSVPAANLSDRLYSMADVATGQIEITGDPDWLQQSEVFYNRTVELAPFMPDGSCNFDGSEVLFEIRFNPVVDYDLATGLTPVYENNIKMDSATGEKNIPRENIVYTATTVTSKFSQGSFTQTLYGAYRDFAASVNSPESTDGIKVELYTGDDPRFADLDIGGQEIDNEDYFLGDPSNDFANGSGFVPFGGTGGFGAGLPAPQAPAGKNTPRSSGTPNKTMRLQSNGTRTNFNVQAAIDKGLPFRDTQIGGELVRVYGNERDLVQYIGTQAVPAKPGAGENAVDSDAGDSIPFGGVGGFGRGTA